MRPDPEYDVQDDPDYVPPEPTYDINQIPQEGLDLDDAYVDADFEGEEEP